jgi:hypothetical protein
MNKPAITNEHTTFSKKTSLPWSTIFSIQPLTTSYRRTPTPSIVGSDPTNQSSTKVDAKLLLTIQSLKFIYPQPIFTHPPPARGSTKIEAAIPHLLHSSKNISDHYTNIPTITRTTPIIIIQIQILVQYFSSSRSLSLISQHDCRPC